MGVESVNSKQDRHQSLIFKSRDAKECQLHVRMAVGVLRLVLDFLIVSWMHLVIVRTLTVHISTRADN